MEQFGRQSSEQAVRDGGSNAVAASQTGLPCRYRLPYGPECGRTDVDGDKFCRHHHLKLVNWCAVYKSADDTFQAIKLPPGRFDPAATRLKIAWGYAALRWRIEVARRFFCDDDESGGHGKRIQWLRVGVKGLEDMLGRHEGRYVPFYSPHGSFCYVWGCNLYHPGQACLPRLFDLQPVTYPHGFTPGLW